jgi:hypothetical protein
MPIINQKKWQEYVEGNQDPYAKVCIDITRRLMQLLDEEPETPIKQGWGHFGVLGLINRAIAIIGEDEITGNMVGIIAYIVSDCHSRGEEFRRMWNLEIQKKWICEARCKSKTITAKPG